MLNIDEKEIKEDIKKYASIDALSDYDGGKILKETLLNDISSAIDVLLSSYKSASHIELITTIARLEAKLNLYRVIDRAKKNKELAVEALKEKQQGL